MATKKKPTRKKRAKSSPAKPTLGKGLARGAITPFDQIYAETQESEAVDSSRARTNKTHQANEYRYVGVAASVQFCGVTFKRDENTSVSSLTPAQVLQLAGNPFFASADSKTHSPDVERPDPPPAPPGDKRTEGEVLADKCTQVITG